MAIPYGNQLTIIRNTGVNTLVKILFALQYFIVVLVMLVSCADNPTTHFHLLTSYKINALEKNKQLFSTKAIGIREIKLPAYLDRPQIVTRAGKNELVLSYLHQWAEALSQSVPRVIVKDLQARIPTINVLSYPWSHTSNRDLEISIQINQFEIVDQQRCVLDVDWWVFSSVNQLVHIDHSVMTVAINKKDYVSYVAAQSEALEQFSSVLGVKILTILGNE